MRKMLIIFLFLFTILRFPKKNNP